VSPNMRPELLSIRIKRMLATSFDAAIIKT